MTLESLVDHYGTVVIFIGTVLEGETIVLLGGFAAHRGYLSVWEVIVAAFAGTFAADQFYFFMGRRYGKTFLSRRPTWVDRLARVQKLIARYESVLIIGFRFLYGLRTVTPFVFGMSPVRRWRFFVLNAIGAFLWAIAITLCGYAFGVILEALIDELHRYEIFLFVLIAAIGALVWLVYFLKRRWALHRSA
ncbi:MAG: DedA family protein [Acidiferrobacterales bacterium]|nr:DedA family protein [Acidiferrobacterales bacterium]